MGSGMNLTFESFLKVIIIFERYVLLSFAPLMFVVITVTKNNVIIEYVRYAYWGE